MTGVISKILGVILVFFMALSMVANAVVSEQLQARRSIVSEVTNFIDETTDTGGFDDARLADFYLGCNAYGPLVDVQITRYVKVVNPDPVNAGQTLTTYIVSTDITTWNKGDIIKVSVEEVGPTGFASFLYRMFHISLAPVEFSLSGRVRV